MIIEGKTKSGFKFAVDDRVINDWDLVDAIGMSESDDASEQIRGMRILTKLILGDQVNALKKHVAKAHDGFHPSDVMTAEIAEIITLVRELKNSQSSEG